MGWRRSEVWFDIEVLWFNENPRPGLAFAGPASAALGRPIPNGLVASRLRRAAKRHKRRSRRAGAAALVVGSTAVIPLAVHRYGSGASEAKPLAEDPPSLSFRVVPVGREVARAATVAAAQKPRGLAYSAADIDWRAGTSRGLPFGGSLSGGTQLPQEGPNWVTWDPVTDSPPTSLSASTGTSTRFARSSACSPPTAKPTRTRRVSSSATSASAAAGRWTSTSPTRTASTSTSTTRVAIDPAGTGRDEPGRPRPRPGSPRPLRRRRCADVFVGFSTGLHGPGGVVIPYPNHENHMHVRFPPPG